jgi:hypothetical protein
LPGLAAPKGGETQAHPISAPRPAQLLSCTVFSCCSSLTSSQRSAGGTRASQRRAKGREREEEGVDEFVSPPSRLLQHAHVQKGPLVFFSSHRKPVGGSQRASVPLCSSTGPRPQRHRRPSLTPVHSPSLAGRGGSNRASRPSWPRLGKAAFTWLGLH